MYRSALLSAYALVELEVGNLELWRIDFVDHLGQTRRVEWRIGGAGDISGKLWEYTLCFFSVTDND
jgi:hypothetical protein